MKRRGQIYSVLQRRLDTNHKGRRRASKADIVGDRSIKEVFHATDEFFDSIRIMAEDYKVFRKRFVKSAGERVIKDLLILKKTVTQNRAFLQWLIDNLPKPVGKTTITKTSILYQAAKFDELDATEKQNRFKDLDRIVDGYNYVKRYSILNNNPDFLDKATEQMFKSARGISNEEKESLTKNLHKEFDSFKKSNKGKYFILDNLTVVSDEIVLNNSERSIEFDRMFSNSWAELFIEKIN